MAIQALISVQSSAPRTDAAWSRPARPIFENRMVRAKMKMSVAMLRMVVSERRSPAWASKRCGLRAVAQPQGDEPGNPADHPQNRRGGGWSIEHDGRKAQPGQCSGGEKPGGARRPFPVGLAVSVIAGQPGEQQVGDQ